MSDAGDEGFTLVEVLVAITILILGLSLIYNAFGLGVLGSSASDRKRRVVLDAENLTNEIGRSLPLMSGSQTGVFSDGLRWTVTCERLDFAHHIDAPSRAIAYKVYIDIDGADHSPLVLKTILLTPNTSLQ